MFIALYYIRIEMTINKMLGLEKKTFTHFDNRQRENNTQHRMQSNSCSAGGPQRRCKNVRFHQNLHGYI